MVVSVEAPPATRWSQELDLQGAAFPCGVRNRRVFVCTLEGGDLRALQAAVVHARRAASWSSCGVRRHLLLPFVFGRSGCEAGPAGVAVEAGRRFFCSQG